MENNLRDPTKTLWCFKIQIARCLFQNLVREETRRGFVCGKRRSCFFFSLGAVFLVFLHWPLLLFKMEKQGRESESDSSWLMLIYLAEFSGTGLLFFNLEHTQEVVFYFLYISGCFCWLPVISMWTKSFSTAWMDYFVSCCSGHSDSISTSQSAGSCSLLPHSNGLVARLTQLTTCRQCWNSVSRWESIMV